MKLYLFLYILTDIAKRVYIFPNCLEQNFNIFELDFLVPLLVLHFIEIWILPLLVLVVVLLKSGEISVQNI